MAVPDALDPTDGFLRLIIRRPDGTVVRYMPPMRLCKQAQLVTLRPGEAMPTLEGAPIFLSSSGPVFTEPGTYALRADLMGVDGARVATSGPVTLRVRVPACATERFAEAMWTPPQGMRALYLSHPLAESAGWEELEEQARSLGIDRQKDNTTWSYLNYIAGVGWLTPFSAYSTRVELGADAERALQRFASVDATNLPSSVARRQRELEKLVPRCFEWIPAEARLAIPARPPL